MILRVSDDLFDRIVVDGHVDLPRAAELLEVILDAASEGRDVYVDIGEVETMGFPALQILAAAVKDFKGRGKRLLISQPSIACEETLELAGLKPLFYG